MNVRQYSSIRFCRTPPLIARVIVFLFSQLLFALAKSRGRCGSECQRGPQSAASAIGDVERRFKTPVGHRASYCREKLNILLLFFRLRLFGSYSQPRVVHQGCVLRATGVRRVLPERAITSTVSVVVGRYRLSCNCDWHLDTSSDIAVARLGFRMLLGGAAAVAGRFVDAASL